VVFAALVGAVSSQAQSSSITLAWNRSTDSVAGYRVYQGAASRSYTTNFDAGNATNGVLSGLTAGQTYYFAVTAYTAGGVQSGYSTEVSYTASSNAPPVLTLTSPASGAAYAGPATISCAASVTANGHAISKVQFYNGATLVGESATAPYSWNWSNVPAGNYSVSARLVYDSGLTLNSAVAPVTVAAAPPPPVSLPAPWLTADIGSPGATGSASVLSNVFTVAGAGNLGGAADNFRYVYQALTGDGEIRARVQSAGSAGASSAAGVMIRETLTSGSGYVFAGVSNGSYCFQRRNSTGGTAASTTAGTATPPNAWVRLVRAGKSFTRYTSADGVNWSQVDSRNLNLAANIYIGLAVASGASATLNTCAFANVTAIP
jgi:hypothetical protein